jgi:hypothetical protein
MPTGAGRASGCSIRVPLLDGEVPRALRGEGSTVPVAGPRSHPQPGQPGHQIELGGAGVPQRDRAQPHAAAGDDDALHDDGLLERIVPTRLEGQLVVGNQRHAQHITTDELVEPTLEHRICASTVGGMKKVLRTT